MKQELRVLVAKTEWRVPSPPLLALDLSWTSGQGWKARMVVQSLRGAQGPSLWLRGVRPTYALFSLLLLSLMVSIPSKEVKLKVSFPPAHPSKLGMVESALCTHHGTQ